MEKVRTKNLISWALVPAPVILSRDLWSKKKENWCLESFPISVFICDSGSFGLRVWLQFVYLLQITYFFTDLYLEEWVLVWYLEAWNFLVQLSIGTFILRLAGRKIVFFLWCCKWHCWILQVECFCKIIVQSFFFFPSQYKHSL